MSEIRPDLSDASRCVSVHWSLPVQCVLPRAHRSNWHEAWHPHTGNRVRYRRSMGTFRTEELVDGEWRLLEIPPPGGYCSDIYRSYPHVMCTQAYGHPLSWQHTATVDGCRYTWKTPLPKALTPAQLLYDVKDMRAAVYEQAGRIQRAVARLGAVNASTASDDAVALAFDLLAVLSGVEKAAEESAR